jgi:HAD superfamily hydrolase (TIGR01549 family)
LKNKAIKAVIFDLDHTLIRSGIDFSEMKTKIVDYLEQQFPSLKKLDKSRPTYEITRSLIETLQKQGLREVIPKTMEEINRIMNDAEMKYASAATPVEGAVSTLRRIKAAGMKIGILTRSCRQYTEEVLKNTGLSAFVDAVAARDDCPNPKPDPEQVYWLMEEMKVNPDEVIMVGDHPVDALCAKNAGIGFVGVLTGSWKTEQTRQLGPAVIPSVSELPDLLNV